MAEDPESDASVSPSDSVYQHKGNIPTPRFIYIHYLDRRVRPFPAYLFEYPDPVEDIQTAVDEAVGEIQNGKEPLPIVGNGITWTQLSYLVFVMKKNQGRLTKRQGVRIWHTGTFQNHCFFNGKDLEDVRGCSAMYCINFRKNRRGDPLGDGEMEHFRWEAYHSHTLNSVLALNFFSHTSSETNLGP